MAKEYIITMTAANRAGILAAVTKAMADLGADLREASQTLVRGFFTMIFSADFPDSLDPSIIRDHLTDAGRPFGIEVGLKEPVMDDSNDQSTAGRRVCVMRVGGTNRPGALRALSSALAIRQADIWGLHAVRTPDTGGFEVVMKLALPHNSSPEQLVQELQAGGTDFGMKAELKNT